MRTDGPPLPGKASEDPPDQSMELDGSRQSLLVVVGYHSALVIPDGKTNVATQTVDPFTHRWSAMG
jgi:hypothetical protein